MARSDLASFLFVLSHKYMANLGIEHSQVVIWIFWYLKGARDIGLVYYRASPHDDSMDVRFVNSNYDGDLEKKSSLTSNIFTLSDCVINWKAALQSRVTIYHKGRVHASNIQ